MNPPKGLYARIGNKAVLDEKISECEGHDFSVASTSFDSSLDSVVIDDGGEMVLRALNTGAGEFMIMYNPAYYPKPEANA